MTGDDLALSAADQARLEKLLLRFDENWTASAFSDAFADLILEPDVFCRVAFYELIKIDLHRHWASGKRQQVDEYASALESVGLPTEMPAQLVLAEFLARHAVGKAPPAKEIRERFPNQFDEFKRLLAEEKSRRTGLSQVQASISTDAGKAAIDTKTEAQINPHTLPETFGRYKILRQLGAGAMGAVYLAHDTQLDRQVALKTPSFGGGVTDDLVQRFYREARAGGQPAPPQYLYGIRRG